MEDNIKRQKTNDEPSSSFELYSSETAQEKALRIPLIVDKILEEMSMKELKTVRQVNKYWKSVASKVMRKQNRLRLHFSFHPEESEYKFEKICKKPQKLRDCRVNVVAPPSRSLRELVSILENSSDGLFPCTDFFFTGGDLSKGGAAEFFSLHGNSIKTLMLNGGSPSRRTIQNLFSNRQAPNIEKLSVNFHRLSGSSLWNLRNLCFHSLKRLHFGNEMDVDFQRRRIALDIVENAVKGGRLEAIGNFPIVEMTTEFWKAHGHLMQEYNVSPNTPATCEELGKFSAVEPALKILSMKRTKLSPLISSYTWPNVNPHELESVVKVLKSSQNSLKILHWKSIGSIPRIIFPKLTHLTLHLNTGAGDKFDAALLKKLFPAIKSIRIDLDRSDWTEDGERWENFFVSSPSENNERHVIFDSVEELEVTKGVPKKWWTNFHVMFPNIKTLRSEHLLARVSNVFELWNNLQEVICGANHVFCRRDSLAEWLHQALDVMSQRLDNANQLVQGLVLKPDPPMEPTIFKL